ncbi:helix-turn-helix transcriptional regulator [Rhizobium sp. AQ_MP]|uniref:TetR/AcrR family transcriptional regulator n=1 Tax=Rhizobium sp. AQ_MP TaxID=2761536 RepID=UPI00163A8693|nr:TetR/AcrR family transcriptional regulator [Rhizobium sp. AQ_MP]MBC2771842.1 helix-turn-helix transcriptional regulator [Rhizobium sp. AQ_MP]
MRTDVEVSPLGIFPEVAEGSTADTILKVAGRLFAQKGFHAISTREIASEVGIRKASLFHHFASKVAIAQHLLEYGRLRSPLLQGEELLPQSRPAVRIYATFRRELELEFTSRYEMRGLYLSDLMEEPDFVFWNERHKRAKQAGERTLAEGMKSGEFIEGSTALFAHFLDSVLLGAIRLQRHADVLEEANVIASLMMRALLSNPADLESIKQEVSKTR